MINFNLNLTHVIQYLENEWIIECKISKRSLIFRLLSLSYRAGYPYKGYLVKYVRDFFSHFIMAMFSSNIH